MKKYYTKYKIFTVLLLIFINSNIFPQAFSIDLSPDTLIINNNQQLEFNISIIPDTEFNASIFLSLDLEYSYNNFSYSITVNPVNYPYNSGSKLHINLWQAPPIGSILKLKVKAEAGNIIKMDSCYIISDSGMRWMIYQNNGLSNNKITVVNVDSSNLYWIGTAGNGLVSFDGFGWIYYNIGTQSYYVTDILFGHNGIIWVGRKDGLARMINNQMEFVRQNIWINSLALDSVGNLWAVFNDGLHFYDGVKWQNFYTPLTYTPDKIMFDSNYNLWATFKYSSGVGRLTDSLWTIYNTSNSKIPYNNITCLEPDGKKIWMGSNDLVLFDNFDFTSFLSPLNGTINTISIDSNLNIWIGAYNQNTSNAYGVARFDHNVWEIFNTINSPLPNDLIGSITCDQNQNVLIGTWNGLALYNSNGEVTNIGINNFVETNFYLEQNYPNPFNPLTNITYSLKEAGQIHIEIYNLIGQLVMSIDQGLKQAGQIYNVKLNMGKFASGIYFYTLHEGSNLITRKMLLLK